MKILYAFPSNLCYMTRPPHPPSFGHTNTLRRVQIVMILAMSFSPFSRCVTSSLLGPYHYIILISTCF